MQFPVSFRLHRSLFYEGLLALASVLSGLGLLFSGLPGIVMLGASGLWLACVLLAWRQRQPKCLEIRLYKEGHLSWLKPGEAPEQLSVLPGTLVNPYLTVLRVATHTGVRHWVLMADSLPPDDFRRLRVWLKWCALTGQRPEATSGAEA